MAFCFFCDRFSTVKIVVKIIILCTIFAIFTILEKDLWLSFSYYKV